MIFGELKIGDRFKYHTWGYTFIKTHDKRRLEGPNAINLFDGAEVFFEQDEDLVYPEPPDPLINNVDYYPFAPDFVFHQYNICKKLHRYCVECRRAGIEHKVQIVPDSNKWNDIEGVYLEKCSGCGVEVPRYYVVDVD